ncbi:hypothetical protein [Chitinophaga rhizosphaerae]|uniref:hypothetical protein n=1 Tax=Chitinophaga rhizosphaerae TaxID=1864947 RepID=UPI000F80A8D8|nr:hypothetical protein [Chitinophaga rhizosphaerae]
MQTTKQIRLTDIEPHMSALQGWLRGNIVGMYAGRKMKNGKQTDQCAVVLHVEYKKSPGRLAMEGDTPIPPFFELPIPQPGGGHVIVDIPTDVQEIGPIEVKYPVRERKVGDPGDFERPCPGGYQIQAGGFPVYGTLGANIKYNNKYRMISCNHVISCNGMYTDVYQPDMTEQYYYLTQVTDYIKLTTYPTKDEQNPYYNTTDFAWCNIAATSGSPAIQDIGVPIGFAAPAVGMEVRYFGAVTNEVTKTTIKSTTYQGIVNVFGNRYAWFKNKILLTDHYAVPGDSGAVLVNNNMEIVGMLQSMTLLRSSACIIPECNDTFAEQENQTV